MQPSSISANDLIKDEIALLLKVDHEGLSVHYDPDSPTCKMVERFSKGRFHLLDYKLDAVLDTCTEHNGILCCDDNTEYTMTVSLTREGILLIERLSAVATQHSEEQAEKRFYRKTEILKLVIPVVTFLAGVLIEHYAGIVDLLFH